WGCNGITAWCITNNAASTRDLYRETVHPQDARRYREGDGWRDFAERQVTIPVRGEVARTRVIRSTVRGPVVNELITPVTEGGDPPLSLHWVGAEHLDDLRAGIAVSRANDWRGFRDAGNPADQWQGYIPFDGLPSSYNPARGYVASANQRIVASDYAHPIYGAYSQGHRGVRIDQEFAGKRGLDRAASIRFQNDVKNCRAERSCPHILRLLAGSADGDVAQVVGALSGWDYRYD